MALLTASPRKVLAVASLALAAGIAAPSAASAKVWCNPITKKCFGKPDTIYLQPGYKKFGGYGSGYGPGWGYGAAAMGGLAVGMIAASAASASAAPASDGECYYVRRKVEDEDGNQYFRRVRVCE